MDGMIEDALQPGSYIGWDEGFSFVSYLGQLGGDIAMVVATDPARAVTLYETFLAGCNEKAGRLTTRMASSGRSPAA
jgi:hypothetical protein